MTQKPASPPPEQEVVYWCPQCHREIKDPLVCGDCLAVLCRTCGAVLESADDLGVG